MVKLIGIYLCVLVLQAIASYIFDRVEKNRKNGKEG